MANEEHLTRLKQGVKAWNQWREENFDIQPDLHEADLHEADLEGANLADAVRQGANLCMVALHGADLTAADLTRAKLLGAKLPMANLSRATLRAAYLPWANLRGADLTTANFHEADLHGADLQRALLVQTKFEGANLTGCKVYGVSTWNVNLSGAQQSDLVITDFDEPAITVDNLEVAQFLYLLLHNEKIRGFIDTITSKAVLILGCFTPERKAVLDAIREELRRRNYLPIVFDFEKLASRDLTEAKSIPQELQRIVPDLPSVPVQPVLQASAAEYSMFEHFTRYPWVLETYRYQSLEEVIASLPEKVIAPAEFKANELLRPTRR